MNIRPLFDRIVVRRDDQADMAETGIYIGKSKDDQPNIGTVVRVGEGKRLEDGTFQPMTIKEGDRVIISAGEEITIDNEAFVVIFERDIVGIIT